MPQVAKEYLWWRHNEPNDVSNERRLDCLLNRLFRRRSKKTSKLRVTGLCEGNSPVTCEFPAQRASNAEMFPFEGIIMMIPGGHLNKKDGLTRYGNSHVKDKTS